MIKTEINSTVNSLNKFRHDQLNTTGTVKINQPSQLMGGPSLMEVRFVPTVQRESLEVCIGSAQYLC